MNMYNMLVCQTPFTPFHIHSKKKSWVLISWHGIAFSTKQLVSFSTGIAENHIEWGWMSSTVHYITNNTILAVFLFSSSIPITKLLPLPRLVAHSIVDRLSEIPFQGHSLINKIILLIFFSSNWYIFIILRENYNPIVFLVYIYNQQYILSLTLSKYN